MPTEAHCKAYQQKLQQLEHRQNMLVETLIDVTKSHKELKQAHEEVKIQLDTIILKIESSRSFVAGVTATITTIGACLGLFFTWWSNGKG